MKGFPKDTKNTTLFMCPYCDSKNKREVEFIPVSSGELFYDGTRDLAFHKPCCNHLAVRIASVGKDGNFKIYDHHIPNPFTKYENFESEYANSRVFFELLNRFGGGSSFVMERKEYFESSEGE